jgi:hypothetical protein
LLANGLFGDDDGDDGEDEDIFAARDRYSDVRASRAGVGSGMPQKRQPIKVDK